MDQTTNLAHEIIPQSNTLTTSSPSDPNPSDRMHLSKLLASGSFLAATVSALQRPFSIELDTPHNDSEGAVRRLRGFEESDLTATIVSHPDILTVYDLVRNAVEQWTNKDCLGSRSLVKQHSEEKIVTKFINGVETPVPKTWYYSELSPYQYRTYNELGIESGAIGAGLSKLGLKAGDKVGLYADTSYVPTKDKSNGSAEWQLFAQGCVTQSLPIVTAYAALGKEGLTHSLQQTEAKAIFTDSNLLKNLPAIISSTSLSHIIYNGTIDDQTLRALTKIKQIKTVISYDDLTSLGTRNPIPPTPPNVSDVACIMYTSGSTGTPKGVVLTHGNVISAGNFSYNGLLTSSRGSR
jgi:long-chain acyl-CoA synthetase